MWCLNKCNSTVYYDGKSSDFSRFVHVRKGKMLSQRIHIAGIQLRILSNSINWSFIDCITRYNSTNPNETRSDLRDDVMRWMKTLNDIDQRKIRYCQNEVSRVIIVDIFFLSIFICKIHY